MRNQVDHVRNELVKAKADWERERKRISSEHQDEFEQLKQEMEEKGE